MLNSGAPICYLCFNGLLTWSWVHFLHLITELCSLLFLVHVFQLNLEFDGLLLDDINRNHFLMQVIYIAPLKAIVRERMNDWKKHLVSKLGKQMVLKILFSSHICIIMTSV